MLGGVLLDRIVLLKGYNTGTKSKCRITSNDKRLGYPDYAFLMYLADGLFLLVVLLVIRFDVIAERDSPRSKKCVSVTAGIGRIIRLIDVDIFAFVMLLLGTFWGFFESFLFVFLTDLGANSFLFGNSAQASPFVTHSNLLQLITRADAHLGLRRRRSFPLRVRQAH